MVRLATAESHHSAISVTAVAHLQHIVIASVDSRPIAFHQPAVTSVRHAAIKAKKPNTVSSTNDALNEVTIRTESYDITFEGFMVRNAQLIHQTIQDFLSRFRFIRICTLVVFVVNTTVCCS